MREHGVNEHSGREWAVYSFRGQTLRVTINDEGWEDDSISNNYDTFVDQISKLPDDIAKFLIDLLAAGAGLPSTQANTPEKAKS